MSGSRRVRNEGEGLGWEEWATRFKYLRYNNKKNLIDPEKPWKVEKNIIIPFDVLEKSPEEIAEWKNRELERLKQKNFELYNKPHIFATQHLDMANFILSDFFFIYPGSNDDPIHLSGEILSNAFSIVDYDGEKVEIAKFVRQNNYCCLTAEFDKVLPSLNISKEENKSKVREILRCDKEWKEPKVVLDKYYQVPYEKFYTQDRIFIPYEERS